MLEGRSDSTVQSSSEDQRRPVVVRVRLAVGAMGAAVLGATLHVLHHVGPLAGAALLAGVMGKLVFGVVGFVAALPMLLRLRSRTGSWRVPGGVLVVMMVVFMFSSFVIGPALTSEDKEDSPSQKNPPTSKSVPKGHEAHH